MNYITDSEKDKMTRRGFLGACFYSIVGIITAALAVPITGYLLPPARKRERKWVDIGPVSGFKIGQPMLTEIVPPEKDGWMDPAKEGVYVVNRGNGDFDIFSINCTHLGCPIQWNPQADRFFSPCHGGVFAKDGKVLGGPPPRPLDKMPARIENGRLLVDYKRFLVGIPENVEI